MIAWVRKGVCGWAALIAAAKFVRVYVCMIVWVGLCVCVCVCVCDCMGEGVCGWANFDCCRKECVCVDVSVWM